MLKKIMLIVLITIIVLSFKLLVINNFFVLKSFYWDTFSYNWRERDYRLEGKEGCKILEIGKKGIYYYGKVSSDGITIYREGYDLYSYCKNEYFLINKNEGLDRGIYYKNKKDILNITKEYKVKKPYNFFMFSILR